MGSAAGDGGAPIPLLLLRHACRLWDSPAMLAAVWAAAALSSVAVLAQHQRLAEAAHARAASSSPTAARPLLRAGSSAAQLSGLPAVSAEGAARRQPPGLADALRQFAPAPEEAKLRRQALATLLRIVENLQQHPQDSKYTQIWKENFVFQKALGQLTGHQLVMQALGFSDERGKEAWRFSWAGTSPEVLEEQRLQLRAALR
eukprot:TRINITY_DN51671_c0_g1_i1.p1 TRINITY_DN51671_c0_g1~~TRINITY_DN51671_c0_g1_i1.p1  ORF type:complete len:211 (-),score=62.34 TRINITY_DN51671_c0_g1_i1:20-625(-)